jgi:two-component system sensor histidine kinase KdpD
VEAGVVGSSVHLRVIDRGRGIALSERTKVLAPFQRLGDQHTNGVGLGFSIAQGFVEAMHGTLTLDDTPGGGLTVTIILPIAEVEGGSS